MRCRLLFFIPWLSLLAAPAVQAASSGQADEIAAYFRLLWGLLAVVGILLVLYAIVKKRFSIFNTRGNNAIKVLEIRPLQPRKALCLIEVRGKEYLLGLSADHISLIAALDQPPAGSFGSILSTAQQQENQPCPGSQKSA